MEMTRLDIETCYLYGCNDGDAEFLAPLSAPVLIPDNWKSSILNIWFPPRRRVRSLHGFYVVDR